MRISYKGLELIKSFESFSAKTYLCPAGFPTIGYGHRIIDGANYTSISKKEASLLLINDLNMVEKTIERNIDITLSQNQFDALCSFIFNVGASAFQRSTLRQKINYLSSNNEIANEFERWVYAGGRKLSGLVVRRKIEAKLFCVDIL
ncbi:MAG UNVERIFIED_CONTAM: lysozyme [Rickettsiaceae bacterium]